MSGNGIPVIKFLFNADFKVLNEALSISPAFEVEEISNATDLTTYLTTVNAGLVIASLRDKNDLVQIATLMKSAKKIAQTTTLKMVIINFSGDKQFEKAIAKLGIQDMVEPGVNTKALKFKLDFWMKSLNAQVKNNPNTQQSVKSLETKSTEKKTVENVGPNWLEPLDLEDDVWLIRQDSDCKKVLSKWLIRLFGPSPYVGQWNEVKANLWRFDVKENEKELYVPGKGAWFFHGEQRPDFVWKENIWLVSGDSFELFYKDDEKIFSRMKAKDKGLSICKNSLYAKTKEQIILESFDKEMVFRKESENLEDLEGKGKTDQLSGGPLSGKNKTDKLNGGPLSGNVNPEDALLGSDLLTQNSKTASEKTHWKGKNAYEKDQGAGMEGPASAGITDGSELGLDRKNTDHQKFYKGHNPAEQFEAEKKEHERSGYQEKTGTDMSGKSSTDQIDGHYGKQRDPGEQTAKEKEMSGKSSTDNLKSHYSSEDNGTRPEEKKKSRAELDYPGTDPENHSSRTSMKNGFDANNGNGMDGESKTDKMSSHYSSPSKSNEKNNPRVETADPYADLFGSSHDKKSAPPAARKQDLKPDMSFEDALDGDVVSLDKARAEKSKKAPTFDPGLEEACADAKIVSRIIQDSVHAECKLDDFYDETIIFSTSKTGFTDGKIKLELLFQYLGKDTKLNLEGSVVSVDGDGEGNDFVTIQLKKEHVTNFETFMRLYESRQKNVNSFLQRVRGF